MNFKDAFFAAKVPTEAVAIPEVGATVLVRGMTGAERDAFEASCFKGKGKNKEFTAANLRAKLVAFCCVDEHGGRVFSDADVEAIGNARADLVDRIFSVAQRLSGMAETDLDELGLRSATPTPSSTSSSASPLS